MPRPLNIPAVVAALREISAETRGPGTIYLCGGASAVLCGWRTTTVDIDMTFGQEPGNIYAAIQKVSRDTGASVEHAGPHHFVPALDGWEDRNVLVDQFGDVRVMHFDFYTQAFAKLSRFMGHDRFDVLKMVDAGLCRPHILANLVGRARVEAPKFPRLSVDDVLERLREILAR